MVWKALTEGCSRHLAAPRDRVSKRSSHGLANWGSAGEARSTLARDRHPISTAATPVPRSQARVRALVATHVGLGTGPHWETQENKNVAGATGTQKYTRRCLHACQRLRPPPGACRAARPNSAAQRPIRARSCANRPIGSDVPSRSWGLDSQRRGRRFKSDHLHRKSRRKRRDFAVLGQVAISAGDFVPVCTLCTSCVLLAVAISCRAPGRHWRANGAATGARGQVSRMGS